MGRLEGKTILVTGAGRGLGLAMTEGFVREGASVVAAARDFKRLQEAVAPLGGKAIAVQADLGVPADVDNLFAEVDRRFGKLDALINNAAIYDFFLIADAAPERIIASVNANFLAPILCTRAAIPLLRKAGAGDIVNISSEGMYKHYAYLATYAATKAGLENFTTSMRAELRQDRIRVTTLRVGAMASASNQMDPSIMTDFMARNGASLAASGTTLMSLDSVVATALNMLTLPDDVAYEIVEMRPKI